MSVLPYVIMLIALISLAVTIKALLYGKKLSAMMKIGIVVIMLVLSAHGQEPPPGPWCDQRPVIFPVDQLPQVIEAVNGAISSMFDHEMFLSDDYWPCNFGGNNTTLFVDLSA
jgi:hypothetical protein